MIKNLEYLMNDITILIFKFICENFYNPVKKIKIDNFEMKLTYIKKKFIIKNLKMSH